MNAPEAGQLMSQNVSGDVRMSRIITLYYK